MEWKWVKSLLIFLFLVLNCFLGYLVYQRNAVSTINTEAVDSLEIILESKNIKCNFDLANVEMKRYMRKINISSEKNIEEKFIPISSIDGTEVEYSGRNREIISLPLLIVDFIRDTKISGVNINEIILGYYPEINQIDKNVLIGEATPAWLISLDTGEEYIYNAYIGDKITLKSPEEKSE